MGKEGPQSRLIFIRHLDTNGRRVRNAANETHEGQQLISIIDNNDYLSQDQLLKIYRLGHQLVSDERFPRLPRFSQIPILPGQEELGHNVGTALFELIRNRGSRLTRWEVSPFLRTRKTSDLLREGRRHLPRARRNRDLRERSNGKAERYPTNYAFLATHPRQLAKFLRDRQGYAYPGGENEEMFLRRIGRKARKLERKRKYRQTTVIVAHEKVIIEMAKQLTGKEIGRVLPGTATILVAPAKKGWFEKRRYQLEGNAGQDLTGNSQASSTQAL